MKFLYKKNNFVTLFVLFISFFISIASFAQNSTSNKSVGYMGKRFVLNGYTQASFTEFSERSLPYKEDGILTGLYATWNIEGEYIINRRFGFTLGTMSHRLGLNNTDQARMPDADIRKIKTRTIAIGIKHYMRSEGGLAPVGFYQHLRFQRLFGNQQGYTIEGDEYIKLGTTQPIDGMNLLCYGVGSNFGFGTLPLFSVGADFMMPIPLQDAFERVGDGLANIALTFRFGVAIPLF